MGATSTLTHEQSRLTDVARPLRTWAVTGAVVLSALFAVLAPIWTVRYIPLVDYPNHLASAFVLAHLNDPRFHFHSFYVSNWNSYPYLMMTAILVLLQKVVSINLAGRFLLSLSVISVPAAAWWFLRVVNAGQESLALWTLLTAQNLYFFLYGFINMQLSLALCLVVIAAWVLWLSKPRVFSWCILSIGVTALYFTHLMGAAVAGLVLTVYTIVDKRRWRELLLGWALFLPAAVFYLHAEWHSSSGWLISYRPIAGKLAGLLATVVSASVWVGFLTLVVIGLCCLLAYDRNPEFRWQLPWVASAGVLFALYWVCPAGIGPGLNADRRLLPFILIFGLAAVKVGQRWKLLAVIALALLCIRATALEYDFLSVQPHLDKVLRASSIIPPGSRVLPLVPFEGGAPLIEKHIWAYDVIKGGWFSPCLFHDPGVQPLAIKLQAYNPYSPSSCGQLKDMQWQRVHQDYDYVWAYDTPKYNVPLENIATLLIQADGLRIYQVRKNASR